MHAQLFVVKLHCPTNTLTVLLELLTVLLEYFDLSNVCGTLVDCGTFLKDGGSSTPPKPPWV